MKRQILVFLAAVMVFTGSPAMAADTINMNVSSTEASNDIYNSGCLPGTVEYPVSHHNGAGWYESPEEGRSTPSKYPITKLLGLQSVYTLQEAWNVGQFDRFKSELSNNVMGFRVDLSALSPNTPVRFISNESTNEVFVMMGEFNKVSDNRFETVLQRAMWTELEVLAIGADVVYYNAQGLDQEIFMKKIDAGLGSEVLKTATELLTAGLMNAFISGGQSKTRWLEPGWLSTFGGRLFSVEEMRAAWNMYYAMYLESGLPVRDFYLSVERIDPYVASSIPDLNELLNLACKQKYCLNALLENPGNPPTKLMTKEEWENFQKTGKWQAEAKEAAETGSEKPETKVIHGHVALPTHLVIYFDRDKINLRDDQQQNAMNFKRFAFEKGAQIAANKLSIIVSGHCDYYGSEKYNWGTIGPGRAQLGESFIKQGLREIKNEKGEQYFSETQINDMVIAYSGGESNPLTKNPQQEENTQAERACIVWLGKRQ